jgi:hypothetical protein
MVAKLNLVCYPNIQSRARARARVCVCVCARARARVCSLSFKNLGSKNFPVFPIVNIVAVEKQYALNVMSVLSRHANRIFAASYYIVIYGLSGCNILFPHYLINGAIFWKTLFNIQCVFWFSPQPLFETFLILRGIQRKTVINVQTSPRKQRPLFLSDFNETSIFLAGFPKILKYQISRKSIQWEPSCSMRTDRRTDMAKLIVASHNFANAPKNLIWKTFAVFPNLRPNFYHFSPHLFTVCCQCHLLFRCLRLDQAWHAAGDMFIIPQVNTATTA